MTILKKYSYYLLMGLFFLNIILPPHSSAQNLQPNKTNMIDTLDLKNMDVLDVLKLISQKTDINIIASKEVAGRVSVYLKDMEPEKALEVIVDSHHWAYQKEGGVIRVMSENEFEERYGYKYGEKIMTRIEHLKFAKAGEINKILRDIKGSSGKIIIDDNSNTLIIKDSSQKIDEIRSIIKRLDVPTRTKIFELAYTDTQTMAKHLKEIGTAGVGQVKTDERVNTIIVTDTELKLAEMERVVKAFDKPERVVQIDAKIISVLLSDENKWGIDWQAVVKEMHNADISNSFDILNTGDKKGTLNVGTLADDNYTAMIEALETVGATNILSNPSITTISNKEAKILVGSEEPYVTSTTTTSASGPSTTAESVNFIEVGVKLFVTPTIHKDDFITIKINPEVSSVIRTVVTGNNNFIPVVETSQAETTVTVKNGRTIVIGGLIKEEESESTSRVPVLGRIPLLGYAFKNKTEVKKKTEIVIFLTPKIIEENEHEPT